MEPSISPQGASQPEQKHPLFRITPLSKYLAMALFILLPFIGGYVGYVYAPEKVVEVQVQPEIKTNAALKDSNESDVITTLESASLFDVDAFLNSLPILSDADNEKVTTKANVTSRESIDNPSLCNNIPDACDLIELSGTEYTRQFTTDEWSGIWESMPGVIIRELDKIGFARILSQEKGMMSGATYQKRIGMDFQIIEFSIIPINLCTPPECSVITNDGMTVKIFISDVISKAI